MLLRTRVDPADAPLVRATVQATGFFSPAEVDIAEELVLERLDKGPACGYQFVFAGPPGRWTGYACYGPSELPDGTYDLYWIAVAPGGQSGGLGRALLEAAERLAASQGGRRMLAETSGREQYLPTRSFYERRGYVPVDRVAAFYGPGDDKVVYAKALQPRHWPTLLSVPSSTLDTRAREQ